MRSFCRGPGVSIILPSPPQIPVGNIDGISLDPSSKAGKTILTGWSCNPANPKQILTVNFYLDSSRGVLLGSNRANLPRDSAVGVACKSSNSSYGFVWPTSAILADGQAHQIYAIAQSNLDVAASGALYHSPFALGMSPIGHVDGFNSFSAKQSIYGWTCDPDNYTEALKVSVFLDGLEENGGTFLGSSLANISRSSEVGA